MNAASTDETNQTALSADVHKVVQMGEASASHGESRAHWTQLERQLDQRLPKCFNGSSDDGFYDDDGNANHHWLHARNVTAKLQGAQEAMPAEPPDSASSTMDLTGDDAGGDEHDAAMPDADDADTSDDEDVDIWLEDSDGSAVQPTSGTKRPRTYINAQYRTARNDRHGKKKRRHIIASDLQSNKAVRPSGAMAVDPSRVYPVTFQSKPAVADELVILGVLFVNSVVQAFLPSARDPDELMVFGSTTSSGYAGDYTGIDEFQENFSGIPTPWTIGEALRVGPRQRAWAESIKTEVQQLKHKRKAWGDPVDPSLLRDKFVVKSKIAFKVKLDKRGQIDKYKSRLVGLGYTQREGENFDDTFAAVVRVDTFRMFCAQAAKVGCRIFGLDFEGAYLQSDIDAEIYVSLPDELYTHADLLGLSEEDIGKRGDVFRLKKSLYGLKQAGALWGSLLRSDLEDLGFKRSKSDECLYTIDTEDGFSARLITYVDDVLYFSNDEARMAALIDSLEDPEGKARVFEKNDADWFIGIRIDQDLEKGTVKLSQTAYIDALLKNNALEFDGVGATPTDSPCSSSRFVTAESCPVQPVDSDTKRQQKAYRSVQGAILYLWKCTRPDVTFAANRLGRYASNPGDAHVREMKHLLRYLKGTRELGLTYHRDYSPDFTVSTNSIKEKEKFDLLRPLGYADADWAGDQSTRRSCSGYCVTWMGAAVVYGCGVQQCVALSTTEAEIIALTRATQEVVAVRKLMGDLDGPEAAPTFLFCDNRGAIALAKNNRFHKRTKHIDLRYFYARDKENDGTIRAAKVPTAHNLADSMTKVTSKKVIKDHRLALHGMDIN